MEPGNLTLSGFLGTDDRHYHEIIQDDENILEKLGHTPEEIAERMQKLMDLAGDVYEEPITVDGHYQIEIQLVRGRMICPFAHPGAYRKGIIYLTNLKNNLSVKWTPLSVHFIQSHHFFEGEGSVFRLDPETLVKAIFE